MKYIKSVKKCVAALNTLKVGCGFITNVDTILKAADSKYLANSPNNRCTARNSWNSENRASFVYQCLSNALDFEACGRDADNWCGDGQPISVIVERNSDGTLKIALSIDGGHRLLTLNDFAHNGIPELSCDGYANKHPRYQLLIKMVESLSGFNPATCSDPAKRAIYEKFLSAPIIVRISNGDPNCLNGNNNARTYSSQHKVFNVINETNTYNSLQNIFADHVGVDSAMGYRIGSTTCDKKGEQEEREFIQNLLFVWSCLSGRNKKEKKGSLAKNSAISVIEDFDTFAWMPARYAATYTKLMQTFQTHPEGFFSKDVNGNTVETGYIFSKKFALPDEHKVGKKATNPQGWTVCTFVFQTIARYAYLQVEDMFKQETDNSLERSEREAIYRADIADAVVSYIGNNWDSIKKLYLRMLKLNPTMNHQSDGTGHSNSGMSLAAAMYNLANEKGACNNA